jgi:internalin A
LIKRWIIGEFDQLPEDNKKTQSQLEGMDKDHIPYHEYLNLCQTEGITDELSQRTLIRLLHDLGIVLNFQDDPRLEETNILNLSGSQTAFTRF